MHAHNFHVLSGNVKHKSKFISKNTVAPVVTTTCNQRPLSMSGHFRSLPIIFLYILTVKRFTSKYFTCKMQLNNKTSWHSHVYLHLTYYMKSTYFSYFKKIVDWNCDIWTWNFVFTTYHDKHLFDECFLKSMDPACICIFIRTTSSSERQRNVVFADRN